MASPVWVGRVEKQTSTPQRKNPGIGGPLVHAREEGGDGIVVAIYQGHRTLEVGQDCSLCFGTVGSAIA